MKNTRAQKLFEAGRQAEDAEDSKKALRLYQKALALEPASFHLQFSVACSLYDVGDWKAAIDPGNEEANYNLGKHLLYWNQEEDARGYLSKAARSGHLRARELLQGV